MSSVFSQYIHVLTLVLSRWRVTEISQIILVLLDCRCPLLHFPPSLSTYLSNLSTPSHPLKIILVLTKVDITGPERAAAWTSYFQRTYPEIRIVQVESYQGKEEGSRKQGRKMYEPRLPDPLRYTLMEALKEIHQKMLEPPERIRGDQENVRRWRPSIPHVVDWDKLLNVGTAPTGNIVERVDVHKNQDDENGCELESEFLTIGLIGA